MNRLVQDAGMPNADYNASIRLGVWILAVGFGGFLAWAALAPLDEGVLSPGVVSVESKRKQIDHLTGEIIDKILVGEGKKINEGDELIVLNEVQARASLNSALSQWRIAAATEARLKSERDGLKVVAFPKELAQASADPEAASALRAQEQLFRSRRAALEGELGIIRESVRGLEVQARSLDQLQADREKQVQLFQQQLASFRNLNSQGFVSRNQLLELERQLAEVQSRESETLANIAGTNARLADLRMRGAQREVEYRREVEALPADVHFDAYMNRAAQPVVRGKVTVVSADALMDARAGQPYYAMRVKVPASELKRLGSVKLQPGMQGTVMVKTGERSLLVYLTRPLLRRFTTAMGEH